MDNHRTFFIFLIIALLVYASLNYYLYRRAVQSASPVNFWAWVLRIVVMVGFLSFPLGRALGPDGPLGSILIWMGGFWLAVLAYGVMIALLADLVRLIDLLTGWLPGWITADRQLSGRAVFAGSLVLIVMLITGGFIRSLYLATPEYNVELEGLSPDIEEYRIVAFSDCHLGAMVGERRLKRLLEQVEYQSPDLVLIVGDLIDESTEKLSWMVEPLSGIEARDGVYAVTGNHEFYNGLKGFEDLMRKTGIRLLRNEAVRIDDALVLAGLDDQTGGGSFHLKPLPITKALKDAGADLPVILMHHTPARIDEAVHAGVDLMLCGHVHGGQLWPIKYIPEAIYGVKTGMSRVDGMYFYLTSGAGTWGAPVRVGATPEIVTFILRKKGLKVD